MNPGHRYLLCVDGSPFSNQVIDHVHSMIKPADNLLVLLAITLEEQRASAEVTMENIKKYMYSQGIICSVSFEIGLGKDVRQVIVQKAHDFTAGTVIVGTRGLSQLDSVVMGSVSTYVMYNAPCAVLIVKK